MAELAKIEIEIIADASKATKEVDNFSKSLSKITPNSGAARNSVVALNRVIQDAPFGFIAIQNNIDQVLDSFTNLTAKSGGTKAALKEFASALAGPAGIALAGSAAVSIITSLIQKYGDLATGLRAMFGSMSQAEKAQIALNDAMAKAGGHTRVETDELSFYVSALNDTSRPQQERITAYDELNKKWPGVIQGLTKENALTTEGGQLIAARATQLIDYIKLKGKEQALEKLVAENTEKQIKALDALKRGAKDNSVITALIDIANFGKGNRLLALSNDFKEAANFTDEFAGALQQTRDELIKFDPKLTNLEKVTKGGKLKVDVPEADAIIKKFSIAEIDGFEPLSTRNKKMLQDEFGRITEEALNTPLTTPIGISMAASFDGIDAMIAKFQKLDVITTMQKNVQALSDLVAGPLTDAFSGLFDEILTKGTLSLKSIVNAIKQVIIALVQAVIKAAILQLILSAFGGAGGFAGFGTKLLGGLGFKIPGHATGGITTAPHLAMVGEAGPEAIIPLSKLNGIMANSGGGQQLFLRGSDLYMANRREARKQAFIN